jgi:hypothetical protein
VGYSSLSLSRLATEYYKVPVSAEKSGVSYDPTSDVVQFAFLPQATQVPQAADWVAGSWETAAGNPLYPYSARCLIGPSGVITLGTGIYVAWVKITDNPEIPVTRTGYLQIT